MDAEYMLLGQNTIPWISPPLYISVLFHSRGNKGDKPETFSGCEFQLERLNVNKKGREETVAERGLYR